MTDQTDTAAPPADPDAPTRHTLPSGKVIELRSHRTLLGADVAAAMGAQINDGWLGVTEVRTELIRRMVTEIEPGRAGTAVLDGTAEAVAAQRADDWRVLYMLVGEAWRLVLGLSVIPDMDGHEDPKAPTTGTGDSGPGSADEHQPTTSD